MKSLLLSFLVLPVFGLLAEDINQVELDQFTCQLMDKMSKQNMAHYRIHGLISNNKDGYEVKILIGSDIALIKNPNFKLENIVHMKNFVLGFGLESGIYGVDLIKDLNATAHELALSYFVHYLAETYHATHVRIGNEIKSISSFAPASGWQVHDYSVVQQ